MRLERVIARDARSATEQVIAQFGPDALVVSNQRVDGMTQLIVAVDVERAQLDDDDDARPDTATGAGSGAAAQRPSGAAPREFHARDAAPSSGRAQLQSQRSVSQPARLPKASFGDALLKTGAALRNELRRRHGAAEHDEVDHWLGTEALPPTIQSKPAPTPVPTILPAAAPTALALTAGDGQRESLRAREIVDLVRAEFAAMRRELLLTQQVELLPAPTLPSHVRQLTAMMVAAGVPVGLRALLAEHLRDTDDHESALAEIQRRLGQALVQVPGGATPTGVHALLGASGAGKTSMAVRLAADHARRRGVDRVALVSFDDPRPGAWSQLQMLAARPGVECFRATGADALATILMELAERELVVIDTANDRLADRAAAIRKASPHARLDLVLPADASIATVARFVPEPRIGWHAVMVTKLDEAGQPWPLIQALCNHPLPLAAGACTPEVGQAAVALAGDDLVSLAMRALATTTGLPAEDASPTSPAGMRNMAPDGQAVQARSPQAPEPLHAN